MLTLILTFFTLLQPHALASTADSAIFAPEDAQVCPGVRLPVKDPIPGETLPDDGSVWRVGTNRWNQDWETQYANFIVNNVGQDFLERFQIPADCTDLVMIVRAVFSRIHSLPFVLNDNSQYLRFDSMQFRNTPTISRWNETTWENDLKKDLRFTLFLNQIKSLIGSVNLPESSYPKRIHSLNNSSELSPNILPGTVFQYPEHTSLLARLEPEAPYFPLTELASTAGVVIRELEVYSTPMIRNAARDRGVVGFRWPVNCGKNFVLAPEKSMPDYSEEQYTMDLRGLSLGAYLESIVPGKRRDPDANLVQIKLAEIKSMIVRRLNLISQSNDILAKNKNAFKNHASNLYAQYSTNDLDVAIFNQFNDLEKRISGFTSATTYYTGSLLTKYQIDLGTGKSIPYETFRDALYNQYSATGNKIDSPQIVGADPNDSVERRWGLK